ncbi:MAG: helix-turn-helix domain-containing protein [Clostridia bacterium]|nr:helix-turn-helix domain-containing protein [Clostridia bacterium]
MEKEVLIMALQYKVDVMAALKAHGYSSTKIREEKLIGQSYLQQIRHGDLVSWKTIETLCRLLDCQPGDLIKYIPDDPAAEE